MTKPLAGIRVLDFGRYIAGPYCAALLADMGADVIRIERRDGGEDRQLAPLSETGDGALFMNMNRNKRGLTLDPAHPHSGEIKRRLLASADVVVANLPVDVLQKLGLDYESLTASKPDIILTMISTFGSTGPYARRAGFDTIAQAMSGAMSLTGFPGAPVRSVVAFEDFGTALHAAFGTMVALFERQRTGQGQVVEGALLATGVMLMQSLLAERHVTGIVREQRGNAGLHAAPTDTYRTRDGWIVVQAIGQPMFERWARLVGRADLIADPRCADDLARGDNYHLITAVMAAWTAARTTAEALQQLEAVRLPAGPVYALQEVLNDPQVQARELLQYVDYPGSPAAVPLANTPVRLSATPGEIRRRAPLLGEHTHEVLRELNFSEAEIEAFQTGHVI
ncbi:MAG: CoA transferase [Acidobacteria bacterium]|nr:CoA transferase [Acidobacteriota bacterium]MBI3425451.1 CoA transferase [Acidobacteriota bacterium]